jgi:hypothetical protein
MKDVGRLMAADAWLGNTDRLVGGNVNLGNFFYAAAGTLNAKVKTIDNDSKFQEGSFNARGNLDGNLDSKMRWINMLLEDPTPIIKSFISKFRQLHTGQGHNNAVAAIDEDFIIANVFTGINTGFAEMADVFHNNMDLVRSLKTINEEYGESTNRNYSAAKGLGLYTEKVKGGVPSNQAIEKLKTYVEYRAKQDKTIKGFKWVSNLFNKRGF